MFTAMMKVLLWSSLPRAMGGVHVHGVGVEDWDLWPLVSPVLGNITEQCFTASLEYITLLNRNRGIGIVSRMGEAEEILTSCSDCALIRVWCVVCVMMMEVRGIMETERTSGGRC